MPRITNPGDITTGPGKAVSTDTDQLVLKDYAGGSGVGAYIPPGETTPRDGYPALPCRVCGGVGESVSGLSVEDTILTVGQPNANPAWAGFIPDYTTLGEAVAAANLLMDADAGSPGRAVRILVVGPTVETATPIQIDVDGLIIEGYPTLEGFFDSGAINWSANTPLIDLQGHGDLIFRDLRFVWTGSAPPPALPTRILFTSTSSNVMSRVVIDNCRCNGPIQGFYGPDFAGTSGGFEASSFIRNHAQNLLEFGIIATSSVDAPFQGCVIRDNLFENTTPTTLSFPCIGLAAFGPESESVTIQGNLISGFGYGISTIGAPSTIGRSIITGNVIGNTEQEAIYIEGDANQITGNSLLDVHTNGGGAGIYVNGSNNVVDKNFAILDSSGTAIEIDDAAGGVNNICTENDVTNDTDGSIVVRSAISVVTENKAKSIRTDGGNSTVSLNLISPGAVTGLTVNGDESTVQGNNVASDVRMAGKRSTVIGNQISGGLTILASSTRCAFGDNHISGDMLISADSARHTIEGNVIDGNLTVNSSNQAITGNIIRGLLGMILNSAASSCTITGNKVLNNIQSNGGSCTISGNRVNLNILINGNEQMVTGNWVFNNIIVGGTDCTIESNKADLININGTRATVGGNKVNNITGNVPACTVSGNLVLATLTMNAGAQYCTIGDNKAGQIAVNGDGSTIGDNVFDIDIQVGGADCTISGNRGGGGGAADILVNGLDCILTGNRVQGNMDVNGTGCVITGNHAAAITRGLGANSPPFGTVFVGNRAPGGTFDVPLDNLRYIANNL